MSLVVGTRLGPYEIQSLVGSGGMGEVYRATDTNLKRAVAIKVLPESVAADRDRLARFQREAEVLASLNHPNIATIYGLERADNTTALVMELVEGPTLADRIAQGPISVDEALPIAKQIAEALEVAHEQGIIHRDLKPANIKLRPDGMVKVLDFGLAKALEPMSSTGMDATASPTITSPAMMTGIGVLLGTAAYMSPEQAHGKPVDKRSDIWAFGCVLYEMLTGTRAFGGESVAETLADVMKSEPRWTGLPPNTPTTLRTVMRRCLEKDPRRRIRDIGDVRLVVDGAFAITETTEVSAIPAVRLRVWQQPAALAVIASSVAMATGLAVWIVMLPSPPSPVRLTVAAPANVGLPGPSGGDIVISSDGHRILFVANVTGAGRPYLRAIDQLEPQPLEVRGSNAREFFLSPDGSWVGFFDEPNVLRKVRVNGGPASTITNVTGGPRGASWGADGMVIFATNDPGTGLLRVPADGGDVEVLTKPDGKRSELDHYWPELLPGGNAVLFTILPANGGIEDAQIVVLNLQTREQKVLVPGGSQPRYVPSGHLVYGVAGTLRAVAFDVDRLEVRGDPVPVLQHVVTKGSGAASFSVAQNGTLVYLAGGVQGGSAAQTLVWVDRQGREEPIKAPSRAYFSPRISPDGTRVAVDAVDQEQDIWIWEFTRQTLTRFTFDAAQDSSPVWTPDGLRIVFSSARAGRPNLFSQAADGTGLVERLAAPLDPLFPTSISPDGTGLLVLDDTSKTGFDIGLFPLGGSSDRGASGEARQVTPLAQTTFDEANAEVSPDGRWLVYQSNESGQYEVYVRPFPEVDRGRWQVSTSGGTRPTWAHRGKELFYLAPSGAVMSVAVEGGSTFLAGSPVRLFEGRYLTSLTFRTYDVSPDGQRFLMIKEAGDDQRLGPPTITVVQHFDEELKRLVPTN